MSFPGALLLRIRGTWCAVVVIISGIDSLVYFKKNKVVAFPNIRVAQNMEVETVQK